MKATQYVRSNPAQFTDSNGTKINGGVNEGDTVSVEQTFGKDFPIGTMTYIDGLAFVKNLDGSLVLRSDAEFWEDTNLCVTEDEWNNYAKAKMQQRQKLLDEESQPETPQMKALPPLTPEQKIEAERWARLNYLQIMEAQANHGGVAPLLTADEKKEKESLERQYSEEQVDKARTAYLDAKYGAEFSLMRLADLMLNPAWDGQVINLTSIVMVMGAAVPLPTRPLEFGTYAPGETVNYPRGGVNPVLQGRAGVDRAIAQIESEGGTVLGREITVEAGGVRARPDLLIQNANGSIEFLEVKNGANASFTTNQATAFPIIRNGGAVPRGANAAAAGLDVGAPLPPTPVRVIKY